MLGRLAKSQSLVLFIKEKGMFDKNLLVFFLLLKQDFTTINNIFQFNSI